MMIRYASGLCHRSAGGMAWQQPRLTGRKSASSIKGWRPLPEGARHCRLQDARTESPARRSNPA